MTERERFYIILDMYIPYETIGILLSKLFKNEKLKEFFYNKKISQNLRYIEKNKPKVLKKIGKKFENGEKINVVFYVYDSTKWKCQSVYDLMNKDGRFNIKILATKSGAINKDNPTYQSSDDVIKTYKFFKDKGMSVEYAYDTKNEKFVPFKKFNPDIIIYQHPWYVERSQGPVVCSEFAFTAYVPYYFPIEIEGIDKKIDYYLRFHKYIERYYALDKVVENKLKSKMDNRGVNVIAAGYPNLDYCKDTEQEGEFVIYAPHWTIGGLGDQYGTFEWSGEFMLEYAKSRPDIKWVFKPHPLLYKALLDTKIMNGEEAEKYYNDWAEIGIKYESGDYLDWFKKSKMMITDSCSFLGEYFVTEKPLVLLMAETSQFKSLNHPILRTYYCAKNLDELKKLLETLPENDYMKETRLKALKESGLKEMNAAKNILNDIIEITGGRYAK